MPICFTHSSQTDSHAAWPTCTILSLPQWASNTKGKTKCAVATKPSEKQAIVEGRKRRLDPMWFKMQGGAVILAIFPSWDNHLSCSLSPPPQWFPSPQEQIVGPPAYRKQSLQQQILFFGGQLWQVQFVNINTTPEQVTEKEELKNGGA